MKEVCLQALLYYLVVAPLIGVNATAGQSGLPASIRFFRVFCEAPSISMLLRTYHQGLTWFDTSYTSHTSQEAESRTCSCAKLASIMRHIHPMMAKSALHFPRDSLDCGGDVSAHVTGSATRKLL